MEYEILNIGLLVFIGAFAAFQVVRALRGVGWRPVEATVLSSDVVSEVGASPRQDGDAVRTDGFVARVLCAFRFDGERQSYVMPTAAGRAFFLKPEDAAKELRRLGPGDTCRIWVNPRDPTQAALRRVDAATLLQASLLLPVVLILIFRL